MTVRIVVDANVLIAALFGRSLPLVKDVAAWAELSVPLPQVAEAVAVSTRLASAPALAPAAASIKDRLADLLDVVEPLSPDVFGDHEPVARARLHARGQPDWPVLAAALAIDGAIWSRDIDFFGIGVPVWSTRNIRHADPASAVQDH
jgi:predicted nucleic acid-binding protein